MDPFGQAQAESRPTASDDPHFGESHEADNQRGDQAEGAGVCSEQAQAPQPRHAKVAGRPSKVVARAGAAEWQRLTKTV